MNTRLKNQSPKDYKKSDDRLQKTLAISIRKIDFSETSQVLHLYSKNYGKISCIAKGSKRTRSQFSGTIDLFVLYEIVNLAKGPNGLDILTSANPITSYSNLRKNITNFYAASYVAQFVDELTIEGQENPGLYEEIEQALHSLSQGKDAFSVITKFELQALGILGYLPRFKECGYCKGKINGAKCYFSSRDGGAICLECRTKGPVPMLIDTAILKLLENFPQETQEIETNHKQKIRELLDYHVSSIIGKKLVTSSALRSFEH